MQREAIEYGVVLILSVGFICLPLLGYWLVIRGIVAESAKRTDK